VPVLGVKSIRRDVSDIGLSPGAARVSTVSLTLPTLVPNAIPVRCGYRRRGAGNY
jgi:hypothetical protein